jgi:hypothetical protein
MCAQLSHRIPKPRFVFGQYPTRTTSSMFSEHHFQKNLTGSRPHSRERALAIEHDPIEHVIEHGRDRTLLCGQPLARAMWLARPYRACSRSLA